MKKQLKKLTLSRETLRYLEGRAVKTAAGGWDTQSECVCSYTDCSEVCFKDPGCSGPC
jgi:hypothetical protein